MAMDVEESGAAATGVEALPSELLQLILGNLELQDRMRAAAVSRRWRAAAAEPPFSTAMTLWVAGDVRGGDPRPALAARRRRARDFESLQIKDPHPIGLAEESDERRALSVLSAAALLRQPPCDRLSELRVVLLYTGALYSLSSGTSPEAELLDELLASAPEGLARLELDAPGAHAGHFGRVCRGLRIPRHAPSLRELVLRASGAPATLVQFKGHPTVEFLGAKLVAHSPPDLLRAFPALRSKPESLRPRVQQLAVSAIESGDEADDAAARGDAAALLAAAAAAGVRCRALEAKGLDLSAAAPAAALSSLLRSSSDCVTRAPSSSGTPLELSLLRCRLPCAWPPDAFPGLSRLCIRDPPSALPASMLHWIVGGSHACALRDLQLDCSFEGVAPADLVASLAGLPAGARVSIGPNCIEAWPSEQLSQAMAAACGSGAAGTPALRLPQRLRLLVGPAATAREAPAAGGREAPLSGCTAARVSLGGREALAL
eukprot:tig00000607_g2522.t1